MTVIYPGTVGGEESDREAFELLRRRRSQPANEVPRVLPVSAVLGRTEDAVVALLGITAYTSGMSLDIMVRLRMRPPGLRHGALHDLIGGWYPGADRAIGLLIGLEYADGRIASTLNDRAWPHGGLDDDEPALSPQGGGGSELSVDQNWWLSPLPPDGPLAVVCAFAAAGIEETRTELSQDWTTTGRQAQVLWPWQPEDTSPPPAPEPPVTGWFASRGRRAGADPGHP